MKYSLRKIFCCIKNNEFIYQIFCYPFVDIALTLSNTSFNSFSTSTCFDLFEVTFLFKFFSLSSKSVLFTKLAISFLLAEFACPNVTKIFLILTC